MGKTITLIGGNGDGQTAKVANQIIVALNIEAVAEALLFASKAGADPAKVRQALLGGFAASRILEVHGERMLKRTFAPGFRIAASRQGSEHRAFGRARTQSLAARHVDLSGTVQRQFRRGRSRARRFGDGARAGTAGQSRNPPEGLKRVDIDPREFLLGSFIRRLRRRIPRMRCRAICRHDRADARSSSARARPPPRWRR